MRTSADLYLEAKLLVMGSTYEEMKHKNHGGTTIWAYARVEIVLHVSIFLVCNIGYREEDLGTVILMEVSVRRMICPTWFRTREMLIRS